MKLVETNKTKTWRDKIGKKQIYVCPFCMHEGYEIASTTVTVSHTAPLIEAGEIKLKAPGDELRCGQCNNVVATRIKGKWLMIG